MAQMEWKLEKKTTIGWQKKKEIPLSKVKKNIECSVQ
jgi:hypothetical protein